MERQQTAIEAVGDKRSEGVQRRLGPQSEWRRRMRLSKKGTKEGPMHESAALDNEGGRANVHTWSEERASDTHLRTCSELLGRSPSTDMKQLQGVCREYGRSIRV